MPIPLSEARPDPACSASCGLAARLDRLHAPPRTGLAAHARCLQSGWNEAMPANLKASSVLPRLLLDPARLNPTLDPATRHGILVRKRARCRCPDCRRSAKQKLEHLCDPAAPVAHLA